MADFHPKVTATALAGALTSMIVAEVQRRGISIDAAEASSITVILSFVAGYFVPANGDNGDAAVPDPAVLPPAVAGKL